MSLLPDADIEHLFATLPKPSLETAHSPKAWCDVSLLKLEGHSGGTHSVKLDNMSGPIIGAAAIGCTTLTFDFQHSLNCRVLSPLVSSKAIATL
jgi:hypothetical protein